MKYQKLVDELNTLLDSASVRKEKHQETLKAFLMQIKTEEKKLLAKLSNASDKHSRKKWKRELSLVKDAYAILGT
ncbi:MAG: hypothetical protein GY792_20365 [Gammaproteobacteria bacterium]|nr:hypothetical protein [Gammaproteobacteria bacterium]